MSFTLQYYIQLFSSGVNVCTLLLKELLYLLLFICWTCTITFNSASPLPLLFLFFYSNDLPKIIKTISKPALFADDTSLVITNPSPTNFTIKCHHCIHSTEQMV